MADMLRDRVRAAADDPAPPPHLKPVERRARALRLRRYGSAGLAIIVVCAGVAAPLYGLRHFGETKTPRRVVPAQTFGDGSVSFDSKAGWADLQGGGITACATTATFAPEDVRQLKDLGPDLFGCLNTAAALPADGVLVSASAQDRYVWGQPSAEFAAGAIPPTLDQSHCGANMYEGQPPGTTECRFGITANERNLLIHVWFGTESPDAALMATAQSGLNAMSVSEPASLGNDIAFEPANGWHDQAVTPTNGGAMDALPVAWTSNAALAQYSGNYFPAGPSNKDIENLPPDGIMIEVEQWIGTRNFLPSTADYQPMSLPLQLSNARLIRGGWEGLSITDVSKLYLRGVLNGRPVIVQATFRTTDPSPDLVKEAQFGLNRLVVVPSAPPTAAIDDFGISMQLPDGWQGWLYVGDPTLVATTSSPTNPFYAPEVGQRMAPSDTTIVLDESFALQDVRWPALDGPPQIGPGNLCEGCEVMDDGQPPASGHVLYRNTFTSGGRAFDLYVEFGSAPSVEQLAGVNATLQTLRVAPNPSPTPPAPGGIAVGSLPDGQRPVVRPNDADRTLSWLQASLSVPESWTAWTNLVVDSSEPLNLFALGSWDVPQGAYCAPIDALAQLPSDGVLIWIDRYGPNPPTELEATPWPSSPTVGPGTVPALATTGCTDGTAVQSFVWTSGGRTFGVHVAFGSTVSDANIQAADAALASFTSG